MSSIWWNEYDRYIDLVILVSYVECRIFIMFLMWYSFNYNLDSNEKTCKRNNSKKISSEKMKIWEIFGIIYLTIE